MHRRSATVRPGEHDVRVSDNRDPNHSADLAAFSVIRAMLPSRLDGTEAVRADVEHIVNNLEQRFGRDAVITLVGNLALKALWPIEQRAERAGTTAGAELDADEQRALALLDQDRRDKQ